MTRNRNRTGFNGMLKLTVAAPRTGQPPSVRFDEFDRISDLHPFCVKRYGNQQEWTGRRKGEIVDFIAVGSRGVP